MHASTRFQVINLGPFASRYVDRITARKIKLERYSNDHVITRVGFPSKDRMLPSLGFTIKIWHARDLLFGSVNFQVRSEATTGCVDPFLGGSLAGV